MEQKETDKAIIITVEKSAYEYTEQGALNVIEIWESTDFEIRMTQLEQPNWMIKSYVYLIEMMILDNYDYFDIAKASNVTTQLYEALDEYEPENEYYLIEILANILYNSGVHIIIPATGNIMYSLRYVCV